MKDKKLTINTRKAVCVLFAIVALMTMATFSHGDNVLGGESIGTIWTGVIVAFTGLAMVLAIPHYDFRKINYSSIMLAGCIIIYTLFCMFHSYDSQYNGIILLVEWIGFSFLPGDMKKLSFVMFRKIFIVVCVAGITCYLSYMVGGPIPYKEVPYYFNSDTLSYVDYGVSFLFKADGMVRLCGLCNEPGYLGTFCALLLCADRINLKNKTNWILLVAGIVTFSVAFLIILAVYLLIRTITIIIKSDNVRKKICYSLGIVLVLIMYFAVLPNIKTGDSAIDTTIQRLVITEDGLAGDNRNTKAFDRVFEEVMSVEPLFGMGRGYMAGLELGNNSTYKTMVAEFGVVGCILIWGALLMAALYDSKRKRDALVFVLVFFASIYQRPNIMNLSYLLVLMGGIEYIKASCFVTKNKYDLCALDCSRVVNSGERQDLS